MSRRDDCVVLHQIMDVEPAAAFQVHDRLAVRAGDLQHRLRAGTKARIVRAMADHLHVLADIAQILIHRSTGEDLTEIQLVSLSKTELVARIGTGLDQIHVSAARGGDEIAVLGSLHAVMQEVGREQIVEPAEETAVMDRRVQRIVRAGRADIHDGEWTAAAAARSRSASRTSVTSRAGGTGRSPRSAGPTMTGCT